MTKEEMNQLGVFLTKLAGPHIPKGIAMVLFLVDTESEAAVVAGNVADEDLLAFLMNQLVSIVTQEPKGVKVDMPEKQ